jgi:flagellar basal-body rod protein FlgC
MTTIGQTPTSPVAPPAPRPINLESTTRPMFRTLAIAASGLSAQRARMEVAAQNIANAETTRTPEGGPYRRKVVSLEAIADPASALPTFEFPAAGGASFGQSTKGMSGSMATTVPTTASADSGGVRVAGISEDQSEGALVYDPGHPDANEKGYVRMPNVRVTDEMMEMMDARRVYDANATVFQSAKTMLHTALSL